MTDPPPTSDEPDDVGERKRRRASHAEQRRIADRVLGDWRGVRGFSDAQRRALIGLLIAFLGWIIVGLLLNPTHVPDPLPADAPRAAELADRIDPNQSDVATLSALPQLGEGRARAIVEYRERLRAADPARVVFRNADDLLRVRGIGLAIKAQIEPYLTFPAPPATTTAATP